MNVFFLFYLFREYILEIFMTVFITTLIDTNALMQFIYDRSFMVYEYKTKLFMIVGHIFFL